MGKKPIRRLESKGNKSKRLKMIKSKLTKGKESNQSHCRRNFEKSYKSKSKEKGLGICFHIFTKWFTV